MCNVLCDVCFIKYIMMKCLYDEVLKFMISCFTIYKHDYDDFKAQRFYIHNACHIIN